MERRYNPILDYFEAPVSMGDIINITVAYLDKIVWKDHNRVIYFAMELRYDEQVSCAQVAPMNEQVNYDHDCTDDNGNNLPSFFPGWSGYLWIGTFKGAPAIAKQNLSISTHLANIGIYTGAGGGGSHGPPICIGNRVTTDNDDFLYDLDGLYNCWGYEVRLFEQDWISMALARTLNPNGIWVKNAFNAERNMLYYYTNPPWNPDIMPRSKHKAKWSVPDVEVPNLNFA
jgi:hypothetical protein